MNRDQAYEAVDKGREVVAYSTWPGGKVIGRGRAVGYSERPLVLIEQADGTQLWWQRGLVEVDVISAIVDDYANEPDCPSCGRKESDQNCGPRHPKPVARLKMVNPDVG